VDILNGYNTAQKIKNKQNYKLYLPDQILFPFAGLYTHWVDKTTKALTNNYAILSSKPNAFLAEIHNHKKRLPSF